MRKVDAEKRQPDEQPDGGERDRDDEPRMSYLAQVLARDASPEDDEPEHGGDADDEHRREQRGTAERETGHGRGDEHERADSERRNGEADGHTVNLAPSLSWAA